MKEFWADTNVIIRFITEDPKHQAENVDKIMQYVDNGLLILHIHPIVIAECCYVLESIYKFEKKTISVILRTLVDSVGIIAKERETVQEALTFYADKNVDFEDAYLASIARQSNVSALVTFDQKHYKRLGGEHFSPDELVESIEQ